MSDGLESRMSDLTNDLVVDGTRKALGTDALVGTRTELRETIAAESIGCWTTTWAEGVLLLCSH